MRFAFGLVSLLIAVAIIAWIWSMNTQQVVKSGNQARTQANQIAGRTDDGTPVGETITTDGENGPDGHLKDLVVKDIAPSSPFQSYFGLQKGDKIITIGPLDVGDRYIMADDVKGAQAHLADAYRLAQPLVVERNGQRITLPGGGAGSGAVTAGTGQSQSPGANAAPTTAPSSAAPSTAAPANPPHRETIQDQLRRIPGIRQQQ